MGMEDGSQLKLKTVNVHALNSALISAFAILVVTMGFQQQFQIQCHSGPHLGES